jgi:hypothetical protein
MQARYSRILVSSGLALLCITSLCASAAVNGISQVKLSATLHGQPLMQEASWTIFNLNDQEKPAALLPRHSGTVLLSAGQYRAFVKLNDGITKGHFFRVESGAENTVSVPMD